MNPIVHPDVSPVLDRAALADRLFADMVAAPLRAPAMFRSADPSASRAETQSYADDRSAVHQDDLGGTDEDVKWAKAEAFKSWQQSLYHDRHSDRVVYTLSVVAAQLLCEAGHDVVLRVVHEEPGREILRWRFVSLALPPSTLIAAFAASNDASNPASVRLLNRSIGPDYPVAELHVHHAAMMSFEALWAGVGFSTLTDPGGFFRSVQDRRAICPVLHAGACDDGQDHLHRKHLGVWADVVRQAFIARRVLQHHVWHDTTISDCVRCRQGLAYVGGFVRGQLRRHSCGATPYPWPDDLVAMQRERRAADKTLSRPGPNTIPLHWLDDEAKRERALLRSVFKYLVPREDSPRDPLFEAIFVQYLRIKTTLFRLLVHPPGERGLAKFLEHFTQIKVYAPDADTLPPALPMEQGLAVSAVEYRVAPDAWLANRNRGDFPLKNCRHSDRTLDGSTKCSSRTFMGRDVESAWIIHFKRTKYRERELPLFSGAVAALEKYADKIIRTFNFEPGVLRSLRGLDLCGEEGAQPLWVAAETLRRVRDASCEVISRRPRSTVEPLRFTLHVGEDFTWLTSGVRAVAEPFVWKLIRRGDRVGHGVALTMAPDKWWKRRVGKVIQISRIDRLFDLAFLARYTPDRSAEHDDWLSARIRDVVEAIWPRDLVSQLDDVIGVAIRFWECLGSDLPRKFAKLSRSPRTGRTVDAWLYSYLWDRSTRKRAYACISLAVEDDCCAMSRESDLHESKLLTIARQKLIHDVATWQVCIESNPTSNLVVGSLDAMAAQDFLQRRPTRATGGDKKTLTWTIGTDDPITFSTTLADEYAYAWAGMVLREEDPYDPAYARALLDEAAATSIRMRFTIPNDDDDGECNRVRGRSRTRRD